MKHRHTFVFIAVIMVLLCLFCQIHAIRLLMTSSQDVATSESLDLTVSETAQPVAGEQEASVSKHTDGSSHQNRKLEKLDALEDFISYSTGELQMAEVIRDNKLPLDSYLVVDTTKANWREKKDKLLTDRRKWLSDSMDALEKYFEEEDFSTLSQDEYAKLLEYRDALRQWSEIAYRDDVDLETKITAFKRWHDSNDNNLEIYNIVRNQFNSKYGDIYTKYEMLYNHSGINEILSRTNPNWINRTMTTVRDADGKQHHYRVKLYDK